MTTGHLSTERLLALYHGETGDFVALEHLASCSECREAFDDSRWFLLLRRLPSLVAAGPHPDRDQLAAYQMHALSSPRVAEVERHLRSCEICLARAGRNRMSEQRAAYPSPPAASVRRAMKQFRPRPLRRLGSLLVTGLDKGRGRMLFLPEPAAKRSGSMTHPRAASRRARRAVEKPQLDWMNMTLGSDAERYVSGHLAEAGAPLPRDGEPTKPEPIRIPADGRVIVVTLALEDDQPHLAVQLVAAGEGRSTVQVRMRICSASGERAEAVTDKEGRALLPFDSGESEITIEVKPRLVLRVDFPG